MLDMKNRIRVLRAERNWTQADLAEQIGVSRNAVNSIENGRFDPSLPMAYRFSDVFGLPVEDIFPKEKRR
jgi:putative transcriptional regulator